MKQLKFVVTILSLLGPVLPQAFAAAPANDNFANRIVLPGAVITTAGNSVEATGEAGEPQHWSSTGGKSIWWSWTAPNSVPTTITTSGSDFDTVLSIYTGSVLASLNRVTNNDDYLGVAQSGVIFNAVAGTTYQIAVDGFSGASGNIQLNITNVVPRQLVLFKSTWRYLDDGTDPGVAWRESAFNDAGWSNGIAEFGFGDSDESTVVRRTTAGGQTNVTFYFRKSFTVANAASYTNASLRVIRDDGVVVYLNGNEVLRNNLPGGTISHLSLAQNAIGGSDETTPISGAVNPALLVDGANVLAAEIHQNTNTSSDVSFDLEFSGIRSVPNQVPSVAMSGPASGSSFDAPANIILTAEAGDNDGPITRVEFFQNGNLIGNDTSHPYSQAWNTVGPGNYQLRAVAVDAAGARSTSTVVNVSVTVTANPTNVLVELGSPWKFLDDGSNQGTAWQAGNFNDGAWQTGLAQLGYDTSGAPENDEATVVGYGSDPQNKFVTTYFRRAFTANNVANITNLTLTLLRDDGGVVYLNGTEIYRSANMTGIFAYDGLATDTGDNTIDVVDVSSQLAALVNGTNVLAVEIHQQARSSSDLSFDLRLVAVRNSGTPNVAPQVAISAPANNAQFGAGAPVNYQVTAADSDGSIARVELFRNGIKVGEDTTSPFAISFANPTEGVARFVAAATDNGGALALSAPISLVFTSAAPGSLIPVGAIWRFQDDGSDQGSAWVLPEFDDSAWGSGPSELGYGDGGEATVVRSVGPEGRIITTYFRHAFFVADPSAFTYLTVRLRRDDGAIVYLNGREVFRSNILPGAVNYQTLAQNAGDDGNTWFSNNAPATLLTPGVNYVAVELHQSDPGSSDISFNLELQGNTGPFVNNPPFIAIGSPGDGSVFTEPANIVINPTATDSDGGIDKVEFFSNGVKLGEDNASPFSYTLSGVPIGSYNLQAIATDLFGASATSAVVTVSVVPSTAPELVSKTPTPGAVTDLTQITVQFSEPVDGINASDLLINSVPATSISGSGTTYTFTFSRPLEGVVSVSFAPNAGITDRESPPKPFDPTAAAASWQYTLSDTVAPTVVAIEPLPGSTVPSLNEVEVTFSEAVGGVNASDLRINNVPAASVSGSGDGPYVFSFAQPVNGTVQLVWTNNHGIRDVSAAQNAFAGGSWSYTLNTAVAETNILISEIMYHPSSELASEEYIELHNKGATAINLTGWQFSRGVSFVFPNVSIAANGYLVVAADVAAFNAKYPGVANVVGGWAGRLSNSDEEIELENALGDAINAVTYADEGDWALRRTSAVWPPGFDWVSDHDGLGKSLELINLRMPNQYGQNWSASITTQGTPGRTNSVLATNIPPMVLNVAHFPIVPKSTDPVTVTARLVDELTTGLSATLFWRLDNGGFSTVPMADNGLNGDGLAGDGTYGAILPAQTNRAIVEFYVSATDSGSRTRTWPAATDGSGTQGANALYQVDDGTYQGAQPFYRLILTRADDNTFRNNSRNSDAEFNTTFVSSDGVDTKVRYNASVRYRGQGSRGVTPPNFRLKFPRDQRWNDVSAINLNSQYTHSQLAGSIISRRAGLDSEHAIVVQLRRNGVNEANSGLPQFGSYVHMESRDSDWVENHYPDEANGNLYTCTRNGTDLSYRGIDPQNYINNGYLKDSNGSENDYSDLAALTSALQLTPDAQYTATVRQWVNVDQWMRYLAVMTLIGYGETSIGSDGQPDDYTLFSGENDRRFLIFPHDHDTDMGQGDGSALPPNLSIFRATTGNSQINRFMKWPEFVPIFYAELVHQLNTTFAAPVTEDLLDAYLGSWVPGQRVSDMKNWVAQRRVSVLSQIPLNLTITAPSLTQQNGYYRTTASSVTLNGLANVIETRFVKVNGQFANWTAWQGTWSSTVSLLPGINRVVVQTTDTQGGVLKEATIDIWYDDGSIQSVSGAISGGQTWTAANGPYQLTASVTIGNGATLTIQPGTTVFLNSGVNITVSGSGRLLAEGTEGQRIRFTRLPSATGTWGQIFLNGASQESRIAYADIEYAGSSGGAVRADNSVLYLDHVVFGNTAVQYVNVNNSSFAVRNSVFPTSSGVELFHGNGIPTSGYAIIEGNWFGSTTGLNDIIDFTGGQRPNAILQILGNTFSGASDDVLDLDGTDAHIEGNVFMNVHQATAGGDTASAISGGVDGGNTSELTIVRNLFYDVDHVALAKEGNFYTLINNTAVKVGVSAVNFSEPLRSTTGGAGALLDGNIISDCPLLFENYTSAVMSVTVNRSMLPSAWAGAGTGNLLLDPMLANTNLVTAQTIASDFSLLPGSPALGSGPNGLDRGALVPAGASISGEPASPTALNSATLTVGGPGITHYRYRLNNGAYGAETPVGTPISLGGLSSGAYQVFVIGRNSAGVYQNVANATASRAWVVNASVPVVRLNEVLARNVAAVPVGSRFPDLVELYNPGPSAISLAGIGVSDDADEPFRFVFPAGASINPGQYLILYADSEGTPAGYHLGFGLGQDGDAVYLTASNGRRMDSVRFGLQVADLSIGRRADGTWVLNQPTLGAANVTARTGDPRRLKINEWLADGLTPFPDDFVELFNPDPLPVSLGELYLTDNPIGAPLLHNIESLSFVAGGGFALFIASGDNDAGANHLNFKLSPEQGMIGLMAANGSVIDCVIYGPQTTDISMGRQPNGSSTFAFFTTPTPGAPNPGIVIPNQTLVINEVLAYNINKPDTDGTTPDWVELYNPSASTVNIGDMSLTDDLLTPRRYVFPAGTTIPAGGYLAIRCDGDKPAGPGNTGFGLKQTGGGIYLFDKLANGGSQLSAVNFGVQAADFSIGRVPNGGTNWVLCLESIGSGNIATTLADSGNLKVNEWMADPGPGLDDWFEIYNPNAQPVALGGLYLSDDLLTPAGRRKHLIAPLSFVGSGGYAYQQFFAAGASQIGRGPDFVAFGLSKDADAIGISTPAGNLIDSITFVTQVENVSQGRLPDGGTTIVSFPKTASPTEANYLVLTNVVISEALTHTDLPMEDAIELQNISAGSVNISGWYLSDAKRDPKKFRIPNGTSLAAGAFKVYYEYQFNDSNNPPFFSLSSAKGDEVYLSQTTAGGDLTGYRSQVSFGAAANGVSFGRYVTSVGADFTAMTTRTFGVDNPTTVTQFRSGVGLPNAAPVIGPIVISEIMYHPPDIGTEDNVIEEFVELRNITGAPVALFDAQFPSNTWKLKDGITFSFPQGVTIPANGVVVVVSFDPANTTQLAAFRAKYGMQAGAAVYGPYSGKLDNGGESIELARPDSPQVGGPDNGLVPYILMDKVKYADIAPWPSTPDGLGHSLQRVELAEYGNDPVNWLAATPTPGPQGGSPDGDGDGMDDAWEVTYFGNTSRNGSGDLDGDGMTDLNEFLAGTLPNNASSALRLVVTDTTPTVVTFTAAVNKAYVIEFKNTLSAASWSQLQTVPAGAARTVNVTDAQSTATRFYRLRLQ